MSNAPTSTASSSLAHPAVALVERAAERDYTVPDLASSKQCSPRHIWRLIDAGKIPGVYRLGRLVRIHRATADAWFASGCRPIPRGGNR
jgi:excisionase family DNA binding protein